MSSKAAKFFKWLAVGVFSTLCLVTSCLLAGVTVSRDGQKIFRYLHRNVDKLGENDSEGRKETREVNAEYSIAFGEDGTVFFSGGGVSVALPPGFRVVTPAGVKDATYSFDYYLRNADGSVEFRLSGRPPSSEIRYYDPSDRRSFYNFARSYGVGIAGEAAVDAFPPLFIPTDYSGGGWGVEGCYAYNPELRAETGYEGEYFAFIERGYRNILVVSLAFRPFVRDVAYRQGIEVVKSLRFN